MRVQADVAVVTPRRQGNQIYYSLDPAAVRDLRAAIAELEPKPVGAPELASPVRRSGVGDS